MTLVSRRGFGGLFGVSALGLAMPSLAFGAVPKVVVIGGGAGGATAARYLAKDSAPPPATLPLPPPSPARISAPLSRCLTTTLPIHCLTAC